MLQNFANTVLVVLIKVLHFFQIIAFSCALPFDTKSSRSSSRHLKIGFLLARSRSTYVVSLIIYKVTAATTPNTTGRQEKKPASAKPSGTTISATALEVTRNTTTDSNTASKRCSIHPAWSLITPDYKYLQHHRRYQYNNTVNKSNNTHLHSI